MRRPHPLPLLTAGAALLVVAAIGIEAGLDAAAGTPAAPPTAAVAASGLGGLDGSIDAAQERLEELPGDWRTWAQLGVSYVEQARVTGDASYYQLAERALDRSLEVQPEDNDLALVGRGALANARHDFRGAAEHAEAALAVNPASATAWAVLADARIQLGRYDAATAAVQEMLDLRPGLPALTRASYDRQVRGDFDAATAFLQRALETTDGRSGTAFVRTHLAELAFLQGDLSMARTEAEAGLAAAPDDPGLLAALARVEAAAGNHDEAIRLWNRVVTARPLPEHLAEYGTYLKAIGRDEAAAEQFEVYAAVQDLFTANGVADDLTGAHLEADFGDPAAAIDHAQRERELRRNVDSADAIAWALYAAGRHQEALPFAEEATALGRNASFLYHRGMIEAALGRDAAATQSLRAALELNPYFSPLHAPRAEEALDRLDDR